jgi:hypothetical protein
VELRILRKEPAGFSVEELSRLEEAKDRLGAGAEGGSAWDEDEEDDSRAMEASTN